MAWRLHDTNGRARPWATALLAAAPIALSIPALAASQPPPDWQQRMQFGVQAYEKGENRAAFEAFSKLMIEGGRQFGAADGRMARIYTNMGEVYDEEQQYNYAEECLRKGLKIAEKGYGHASLETVPALIDLGQTYVHEGKNAQAQTLFKQALSIVNKPEDSRLSPYLAVVEANLATMLYTEGSYASAAPHFKRALDVATKAFGASHKWTTTIGAMYAACLHALGKVKEAQAVEQAAMAKANETESRVSIWNKQTQAADDALAQKRYADAEAAAKQALQAAKSLSAEPMLQALTLMQIGNLLLAQEKPAQAVEKFKAAQVIADSVFGKQDESVLRHAKQLADLEKSQDQYADAEPLYLRLLAHAEQQHGVESSECAAALSDLGGLYMSWAQYPKAVPTYSKLLALQKKQFGAESDKLIPTLVALSTATENNLQYLAEANEQAEQYLACASTIAGKHFGKDSKEAIAVLDALSNYYQRRYNWDKAAKVCAQVVSADEKTFGSDSPQTIHALEHYAVVLRAAGMRDKAEPIEARITKIKGAASLSAH